MTKKHLLLGSVSALTMGLLVAPAFAQDDDVETVVVTGIRASLQSAQAIKQNSDQVVDSITAVDIGALPDRNVAEALQRVPGVTLQRNDAPNDLSRMGSTGNSVFVRGLSWVKTLVNGRDEFTAVSGRSLSFADVSADLMAAVNVYKSPTAKMIEGGVGGLVDLITRKPFDQDGRKFAVSGDLTYGDLSDRAVPSINALYSDRWNTGIGELGLLLSVDWQDQFTRTTGVNLYSYSCWDSSYASGLTSAESGYDSCMSNDLGDGRVMAPEGWAWRQLDFHQKRLASNVVMQWRPTDRLEVTLSGINTFAQTSDVEHYVQMSISGTQAQNATYDSRYNWIGGDATITTIDTRAGTGHNRNSDINLNVKYNPTDALELSFDAQFVESSSPYRSVTFFTGISNAPTMTIDASGNTPKISYTSTDTTDPANYYWTAAMDHLQYNVAHAGNFSFNGSYTFQEKGLFGLIKSVDFGARTEQKIAVSRSTGYNWGGLCPQWGWGPWSSCPYLDGSISGSYTARDGTTVSSGSSAIAAVNQYAELYSYHSIMGNKLPSLWVPSARLTSMDTKQSYALFSGIIPQTAVDYFGYQNWSNWYSYSSIAGCTGSDMTCLAAYNNLTGGASSGNRISTQKEQTYAFYLQANFGQDTFLGYDIPVEGNIGVRFVKTRDQIGDGKLVMPSLSQTFCNVGDTDSSGSTYTDCSDWNSAVMFLGGGDLAAAIAGQGATVDRPGVKSKYTNALPSFNLLFHWTENLQSRFSYSEQIVRPDFAYTNSSATLSFDFYDSGTYQAGLFENDPSGYGGNPSLKPMHATNYDASLEWYFSPSGSLTFSMFHKDLSNYIYTATGTATFTHPTSGESMDFDYTTYVNGDKGKVEGFELAYTQFYDQLPGWWGGFGLQVNYTKIYNSGGHNSTTSVSNTISITNSGDSTLPLEGMSNDSYNIALMYSKYGIDARVAWNWRSRYLSSTANSNSPYEPVWMENYGQLDGSVFYSFLDHYKVGVQMTNITGSRFFTDMGYEDYHPRTNWIDVDRKFAVVVRANW